MEVCSNHQRTFTLYCNNCRKFICHDCLVALHQYHMMSSIHDVKIKIETTIMSTIESEISFLHKNIQEYSDMIIDIDKRKHEMQYHDESLLTPLNECVQNMMEFLRKVRIKERNARLMLSTCYRSKRDTDNNEYESYDNNIITTDPDMSHLVPSRLLPPCFPDYPIGHWKFAESLRQNLSIGIQVANFKVLNTFDVDMFVENIQVCTKGQAWIGKLGKVSLYHKDGDKIKSIKSPDSNTLFFTVTQDEELVYSHFETQEVKKVTRFGMCVTLFDTPGFHPRGLCLKSEKELIVCSQGEKFGRVTIYSTKPFREGTILRDFVYGPNGKHLYNKPIKVILNKNGDICVIDADKHKVVVISREGTPKYEYKSYENSSFEPSGLACDTFGNILISDYANKCLILLNMNGIHITSFNMASFGISRPMGLAVDEDGVLWIGQGNGKIHIVRYLK